MISSLPQRIGVIFHEKLFITLPILLVFKLNLVPRCVLYVLLCVPNLEAIQLDVCILWQIFFFFASVWKQENEKKECEHLFEGLYLGNGLRNVLQIWYVFCHDMLAPAHWTWSCDHQAMYVRKIVLFSSCYYTHAVHACSFSWAAQHSTVCTSSYHQ